LLTLPFVIIAICHRNIVMKKLKTRNLYPVLNQQRVAFFNNSLIVLFVYLLFCESTTYMKCMVTISYQFVSKEWLFPLWVTLSLDGFGSIFLNYYFTCILFLISFVKTLFRILDFHIFDLGVKKRHNLSKCTYGA
jgi:hypothetical protein